MNRGENLDRSFGQRRWTEGSSAALLARPGPVRRQPYLGTSRLGHPSPGLLSATLSRCGGGFTIQWAPGRGRQVGRLAPSLPPPRAPLPARYWPYPGHGTRAPPGQTPSLSRCISEQRACAHPGAAPPPRSVPCADRLASSKDLQGLALEGGDYRGPAFKGSEAQKRPFPPPVALLRNSANPS